MLKNSEQLNKVQNGKRRGFSPVNLSTSRYRTRENRTKAEPSESKVKNYNIQDQLRLYTKDFSSFLIDFVVPKCFT